MKEPYVSSTIYDMTGGLSTPPADDGYNIAGAVFTPTGPIEKTKVLSQKDFVDNYLLGSTVLPSDNESIQFVYKILEVNPIYLTRACPVTVLEGITSLGNHLLFDKSFNVLPNYFRFKIAEIKDSLPYYYLVIKKDNSYYQYYTGEEPSAPSGITTTKVPVSATKSLDALLAGIEAKSDGSGNEGIIKSEKGTLVSRCPVTHWSSNIGLHTEIAKPQAYVKINSNTLTSSRLLKEKDYVAIDGTTYYFSGLNKLPVTEFSLPVELKSPDNKANITKDYFFIKLLGKSGCDTYGYLTLSLNQSGSTGEPAKFKSSNIDSLVVSTDKVTILNNSKIDVTTLKSLSVNINGADTNTIFYLGDKDEDTLAENEVLISNNSMYTCEFITQVLDYIIANNKEIYSSDNDASLDVEDGNLTLITDYNNSLSSSIFEILKDTEDTYTYSYYTSVDSNNKDYITYDYLYLVVGKNFFYSGTLPNPANEIPVGATIYQLSPHALTEVEFNNLLLERLYSTMKIGKYKGYFISTAVTEDEETKELVGPTIEYDENKMTIDSKVIEQSVVEQFAIVQKFPSVDPVFKFSYKHNSEDERILDLNLNYKDGTKVEDWTMSFIPGVVDGYGIDQYYTRVDNMYFKVVNLQEDGVYDGEMLSEYKSSAFGDGVEVPEYNVQYMKDAMKELPNYEDGVQYTMLTDSGVIDAGYAKTIETLCTELHAWYPASLPSATTNTADLISYVGAADFKSYFTRLLAAGDRELISGFSSVMPGSLKLIRGVLDLYRSTSNEFAPHFDLNNGTVGVSNLVQSFKKDDRELLLEYKIETLKGGIGSAYYINDNVTAQPKKSYLSENQNVLMTIAAIQVVENYVKYFKAELNTAATRSRCEEGCNAVITDRLFKGKAYAPASYIAKCDETNNTLQVINNNQLVIDLYAQYTPSIKYILVGHYVIPLENA